VRPDRHRTSAFGQRVLDVSQCKPGAVILDVALPPDISAEEAAVRPDVLVVESGEVLIPGPVNFSFDIGLPPNVAYACLAEPRCSRWRSASNASRSGANVAPARVKEIYKLFRRHGFRIAPLRTFGQLLTDEMVATSVNARNGCCATRRYSSVPGPRRRRGSRRSRPRAKGVAGLTTLKA